MILEMMMMVMIVMMVMLMVIQMIKFRREFDKAVLQVHLSDSR